MPYGGGWRVHLQGMELSAVGQPLSHAAAAFSVPESCLLFAYGRARELARLASCFMEPGAFAHKNWTATRTLQSRPHAGPTADNAQRMSDLHHEPVVLPSASNYGFYTALRPGFFGQHKSIQVVVSCAEALS